MLTHPFQCILSPLVYQEHCIEVGNTTEKTERSNLSIINYLISINYGSRLNPLLNVLWGEKLRYPAMPIAVPVQAHPRLWWQGHSSPYTR